MNNTVIKVENLTKQYRILHETKDPYKNFSDTLAEFFKKLIRPWLFFNNKEVEMFKALNDVNFEIKKGEKIAVIGRNGAGKSTLLKVLSRITEPTEGAVKIKGRVVSLLEVGTGFHPELTGRENIFLNGAILGMKKKEISEKFDDIVEFSGCEKFLDTPVKRYSSGMRVRLGFAVAAHLESEILIVDEVLAVGDAEFQKKCLGKMDEISKGEGRTIIFVSHNMSAVQNLCDKGIVMDQGSVKFVGDVAGAINEYTKKSSNLEFNSYNLGEKNLKPSGDIIIKSVEYRDMGDNIVKELDVFKDYNICIKVQVNKWKSNYKLGFTILDKADNVVTVFADNSYVFSNVQTPNVGEYVIYLKVFNVVSSGNYTADIVIKNQSDCENKILNIPYCVSDIIHMENARAQAGFFQSKADFKLKKEK